MSQDSGSQKRPGSRPRFLGITLLSCGLVLLVAVIGYYIYTVVATEKMGSLVYAPRSEADSYNIDTQMTLQGLKDDTIASMVSSDGELPDPSSTKLYPGELLAFKYWAEPWNAEPADSSAADLLRGFISADHFVFGDLGALPQATRIKIPAIGLEADISGLAIKNLGNSRHYETPDHVVGFIPGTANPGEIGNGWLFGHLQSPIRNEGSVFRDLPRIPDILRSGEHVYVILESEAGSYLYEVHQTEVIHGDELRLYDTDGPTVTLVTCVPEFKYDYRLLVTANLIGFKAEL